LDVAIVHRDVEHADHVSIASDRGEKGRIVPGVVLDTD
jgi:hypothetical protein